MTPTDDNSDFPEMDADLAPLSDDGEDANLQADGSTGFQPNNTECLEEAALTEEFVVRTQEEAKQLAEELFGSEADAVLEKIQATFEQAVLTRASAMIEAYEAYVLEEAAKLEEDNQMLWYALLCHERNDIVEAVSEGLAMTQREKLAKITENLEYDGDAESFAEKLLLVRNELFPKKFGTSVDYDGALPEYKPMTSTDPLITAALAQTRKHVRN